MSDFLYFVFVFPLESLLGFVLGAIFNFTKNEAASVILLSLLVNFFLLKIFIWSDKKAQIETVRKKKFEARIARWKSVYAAPKVFAFTQTLYRQNHYHPIFALSALGGLAIQIPFFLAMIFLIQNGTALPSAEFATISAIDSTLGIHILPILMTAITLANVFLSSPEKSARIQGAIIAILFLLLLYEMPHALVLYWTTNMAFSLTRAVWNKFKTPKPPKIKTPKIQKPPFQFSCICKIFKPLFALFSLSSLILFALGTTHFYENSQFLKFSIFFFQAASIIIFFYFFMLTWQKITISQKFNTNFKITTLIILNISFLVCVFTPYELYLSDISQFHPPFTTLTLSALVGVFLLIGLLIIYLISFIPSKIKWIFPFFLSVILGIGILNSFIFTGDFGGMDRFVFQNPLEKSAFSLFQQNATNTLSLFLATIFVYFLFFKLKRILQITLCTMIIVSFFNASIIFDKRQAANQVTNIQPSSFTQEEEKALLENPFFSYSKDKKNIVVIVLDMFSGSHFPYLLEYFPQLKTQLDGFTLFDNALTSSRSTFFTLPSIIGGEYYALINHQSKKVDNIESTITEAYNNTLHTFSQSNYSVALWEPLFEFVQLLQQKINNPFFLFNPTMNTLWEYLFQNTNIQNKHFKNTYNYDIIRFLNFGLFKFAPNGIIRESIYNNGQWLIPSNGKILDANSVITTLSTIYAFAHIGNTKSPKPTFKFIHTFYTHFPYGTYADEKGQCHFLHNKSIWNKPEIFGLKGQDLKSFYQHLDTEACALFLLNNYFEWLKKENIYDNTQIFIVSDHAGRDSIKTMPHLLPEGGKQDILFLFKDFKKRGELKTDSRLMVNYDIATIFCENLENGCPNVAPNILKNYPGNRAVIHARPQDWQLKDWRKIERAYKIQGNIYDPAAYTDVSAEYATVGEFAKKK